MRPLYETTDDLCKEYDFSQYLENAFKCKLRKLPIRYELDFACVRGLEVIAWIETKCRKNTSTRFDTYMLSLHKWQAGCALAEFTGKPFILAIEFTDKKLWLDCVKEQKRGVEIQFKGRTVKRRDWQDEEPVVMIDMKRFQRFNKSTGQRL